MSIHLGMDFYEIIYLNNVMTNKQHILFQINKIVLGDQIIIKIINILLLTNAGDSVIKDKNIITLFIKLDI